jgi:hypothetical protein
MCPTLTTLSLEGNPVSHRMYYRRLVARGGAVQAELSWDPQLETAWFHSTLEPIK